MRIFEVLKKNKKLVTRYFIVFIALLLFIALMAVPSLPYRPSKVSYFSPTNGATDVLERAQITINFEKPIPVEERESYYLRLLPGVSGVTTWPSPDRMIFSPTEPLPPNTTFKLALSYSGESLVDSQFTTRFRKIYTQEEITEINEWAFATSRAMYETFRDYPFLEHMPLTSESYSVMFDSNNEQFRYLLKMPSDAPEVTKYEAIRAATDALISIGVDVEDWGYYVKYPEDL